MTSVTELGASHFMLFVRDIQLPELIPGLRFKATHIQDERAGNGGIQF